MKHFPLLLVADDDENDLRLIARALPPEESEHPHCLVHDGGEALDYIYRRGAFAHRPPGDPGCLLLDLHMPRVNGWDVLRQLQADPGRRSIPVIIFSSSDRERDIRYSYDLGATAYVVKPMEGALFRQAVAAIHAFWITWNRVAPAVRFPPPRGVKFEVA
jgi:CheY-like chemotaxis protein